MSILKFLSIIIFVSICFITLYINNNRTFKIGDCVIDKHEKESWEEPNVMMKILEVGKEKYRLILISQYGPVKISFYFHIINNLYKLTPCSKELEVLK